MFISSIVVYSSQTLLTSFLSSVVRCPYLGADAIANGNRNLTGLQVGNTAVVECNDGFVMNGSGTLTCSENGEWNSLPPTCVRGKLLALNSAEQHQ